MSTFMEYQGLTSCSDEDVPLVQSMVLGVKQHNQLRVGEVLFNDVQHHEVDRDYDDVKSRKGRVG
jgi:hypothetical protein